MLAYRQLLENLPSGSRCFPGGSATRSSKLAQQIRREHDKDCNDPDIEEVINGIHPQIIERIDPCKGDHQKYKLIRRCSIRRFSWPSNSCVLKLEVVDFLPAPSLIIEPGKNAYMIPLSFQASCGGKTSDVMDGITVGQVVVYKVEKS